MLVVQLIIIHPVMKLRAFMKPWGSSPCSQKPCIGSYYMLVWCSSLHILFLLISVLILSPCLHLNTQSDIFPCIFKQIFCMCFLFLCNKCGTHAAYLIFLDSNGQWVKEMHYVYVLLVLAKFALLCFLITLLIWTYILLLILLVL
jgi:hypothetical protein